MLNKLCLESQNMMFKAIEEVMEAFNYTNPYPVKAFHCPHCAAAEPKRINSTQGKTNVLNPVWEDKHQIWEVSTDNYSVVSQRTLCTKLGETKDWDNAFCSVINFMHTIFFNNVNPDQIRISLYSFNCGFGTFSNYFLAYQ